MPVILFVIDFIMLIIYHTAYGFSIAFPIRGYRISAKVFVDFNEEGCRF